MSWFREILNSVKEATDLISEELQDINAHLQQANLEAEKKLKIESDPRLQEARRAMKEALIDLDCSVSFRSECLEIFQKEASLRGRTYDIANLDAWIEQMITNHKNLKL